MNDAQRTALRAAMQFNYPSFPCIGPRDPSLSSRIQRCGIA
jgi:hypothetical protein